MKAIKIIIVSLVGLFGLTACEGFLDRDPLGQQTDQNFYNDPGNAVIAVNGVYEAMTRGEGPSPFGWLAHNYEFMFGDILSDDAAKGSTPNDYLELKEMEEWRTTAANGTVAAAWTNQFVGIFRANGVIQNIPDATIEEGLKTRLLAEARFLRGYFYFYLAKIFGGVPLFETQVDPDAVQNREVSRASLEETFKFIEADFLAAIEGLPEKSQYGDADLGRATKGAAKAFLARVIMYQVGLEINGHNWQEVFDLTQEVVGSGEYALDDNYARLFEIEGENGVESVFEVQAKSNNVANGQSNNDQKTGTNENVFQNNRSVWGWGFNNPTQNLVDQYENGDPRLPCTAYADGDIVLGIVQEVDFPASNETGYLNRKAATLAPNPTKSGDQNIRKIRFADVLMMHAEAAYHLGNENTARTILNQIRDRARMATKPK
ncbi:MAG: RagB/SusD family nutrient uptake outer membrane protein, partial [Bacteroidia bacterium]|nr:RagB/SusD family nutrient uptake outer membrane protein [Bacteroidia bacterium]